MPALRKVPGGFANPGASSCGCASCGPRERGVSGRALSQVGVWVSGQRADIELAERGPPIGKPGGN
eukprot:10786767-Alexandrium_andersonii.AAC.1